MKEFIIYQKGETRVYIHRLKKDSKHKLFSYAIRADNKKCLAEFLGIIKFIGNWRQYASEFEPDTIWSSNCKKKICEFEDMLNARLRKRWKRKKNKD